jgi:hypothetical protein
MGVGVKVESFAAGEVPIKRWLGLAHRVYQNDHLWIPPFDDDVAAELSASHLFLRHGKVRFFIAGQGTTDEARLMASIDDRLKADKEGEVIGCVGHFEMVTLDGAYEAMKAATEWLESEGATTVWGPMNRSIWHGYRFRTKGFHIAPFYGEPYNPPDYPRFFEDYGFEPLKLYRTVQFEAGAGLEKRLPIDKRLLKKLEDRGYSYPSFDLTRFDEEFRKVHSLMMNSYAGFLGFTKLDYEEFFDLFSGLKSLVDDGFVIMPTDPSGELVGVFFSMLDHSTGIRAMAGRSNWLAKMKFLWNKETPTRAVVLFAGMKQEAMRLGVPAGIGALFHMRALGANCTTISHALMAEGLEDFWKRWQRDAMADDWIEYRLYSLDLSRSL